ncbi:hypothetical protein LUR59_000241 [Vibrio parahaemolyticus]|uniref:hypothetical protein n=1 Tax=Vibrio parahaemolyticus TaxID=670 RepID=UPI001301E42E|nr:hypothetical protein [Vibrio parahaemolyticus]EIQ1510171.1 hypothetical protein [Vibrio parahaemolyticus]EJT1885054.1 hypothetical protein [Vibrio parahaemolyticus]ELB2771589.1 hypothetical protein [Vibrio parahaemolyticus]
MTNGKWAAEMQTQEAKSLAEFHGFEIVVPPTSNLAFALKSIKKTLSTSAFLVAWWQQ